MEMPVEAQPQSLAFFAFFIYFWSMTAPSTAPMGRGIRGARGYPFSSRPHHHRFTSSSVCALPCALHEISSLMQQMQGTEQRRRELRNWGGCLSTTSARTFFKPIAIGDTGQIEEQFADAGIGCQGMSWKKPDLYFEAVG